MTDLNNTQFDKYDRTNIGTIHLVCTKQIIKLTQITNNQTIELQTEKQTVKSFPRTKVNSQMSNVRQNPYPDLKALESSKTPGTPKTPKRPDIEKKTFESPSKTNRMKTQLEMMFNDQNIEFDVAIALSTLRKFGVFS